MPSTTKARCGEEPFGTRILTSNPIKHQGETDALAATFPQMPTGTLNLKRSELGNIVQVHLFDLLLQHVPHIG